MKIYVLYDNRRPDSELETLKAELARQGIEDYQAIYSLNIFPTVESTINFSHKNFINLAKHKKEPEVCIIEVDCMFPAQDGWQYFLSKKPRYFDIYLAGCYSELKDGWDEERYVYTQVPAGFHCYIVHSRYYDKFLQAPPDAHIDAAQTDGIFKVCYPFAAIQRPGWSANNRTSVDYNTILRKEDVYGW